MAEPDRRSTNTLFATVLALALSGSPVFGQVPEVGGGLSLDVEAEVLGILNDPSVLRLPGGSRLPAGTAIEGDVAVLGGPLELGGSIDGSLVVVNGDLTLLPGSTVDGTVVVVGGSALGEVAATVVGRLEVHPAALRYRVEDGTILAATTDGVAPGFLTTNLGFGQVRLGFRAVTSYNRVEGLPVRIGPIVQTAGSNPTLLEAFGIWRSVDGLKLDSARLGHFFRLTQAVGGRGTAVIGATAHDEVVAIEDQGLSDLEASLASLVLRKDMRDYFNRRGWSAFARLRPARTPIEITLTYRDEHHTTTLIRDPWTFGSRSKDWRPLSLVAEGPVQTVDARFQLDTRNDPEHPADGWLVDLALARQVGGRLRLPPSALALDGGEDPGLDEATALKQFTTVSLDARQYARVGPSSRLSLRGVVAAGLGGVPLPPQYQWALGGEGTLPGHRRFSVDCGARDVTRLAGADNDDESDLRSVYAAYGCDQVVLFQAEFQSALPFGWSPLSERLEDSEIASLLSLSPEWSVFFDAGRGWSIGEVGTGIPRSDSSLRADVGLGLFLGPLGLYWSYPLNETELGLNFFVRFQHRL